MTFGVGCLAWVGLCAALTVGIDRYAGARVDQDVHWWLSGFAAVLITLGLSNFMQVLTGYGRGDRSRDALLARARTGQPPTDGGPMLVTGRARPDGPALCAPLSGRSCVAYEYRLFEERGETRKRSQTVVSWWGYGCQPFIVETSGRAIRVAARPQLQEAHLDADAATVERVRRHVSTTSFEAVSGALGTASTMPTMLRDVLTTQPGGLRRDWRRSDLDITDPASQTFEEACLPVDEEISVAGYWSPEQQAIVPSPGALGAAVTATTGRAKRLLQDTAIAPHSVTAVLVGGTIMLAIGGGLVWAAGAGYFRP